MFGKRINRINLMLGGGRAHFHHSEEKHYHDRVVEIVLKALKGELVQVVIDGLHAGDGISLALEMLEKQLGVGQGAEADCQLLWT